MISGLALARITTNHVKGMLHKSGIDFTMTFMRKKLINRLAGNHPGQTDKTPQHQSRYWDLINGSLICAYTRIQHPAQKRTLYAENKWDTGLRHQELGVGGLYIAICMETKGGCGLYPCKNDKPFVLNLIHHSNGKWTLTSLWTNCFGSEERFGYSRHKTCPKGDACQHCWCFPCAIWRAGA